MIPKIRVGGETAKRIAYLIGNGHRGEHVNPHLIGSQGLRALPEKVTGELLSNSDVKAITQWLDEPMRIFARHPRRRTERTPVEHEDGSTTRELTGELKLAHYRGWSLTLPEGEKLTDEQWARVAESFMEKMEFHGRGSDALCRWLAVHHGGSGSPGFDHIHIAGNVVAEDGSVWNDYRERNRSHQACDEIAQELAFEHDEGGTFQLSRADRHQRRRGHRFSSRTSSVDAGQNEPSRPYGLLTGDG